MWFASFRVNQPCFRLDCRERQFFRTNVMRQKITSRIEITLRGYSRDFVKAFETTTAINRRKLSCNSGGDYWASDLSFHGRRISRSLQNSVKVFISRLLAPNRCSLAVVVIAIFASRWWPSGKVVISQSLRLWDLGDWSGTFESRSFVAVVVSCAVEKCPTCFKGTALSLIATYR